MFDFIKRIFSKKIKNIKQPTFDFIDNVMNSTDFLFSNTEYNYDVINYLANRFKIPLELIYVQDISYGGVCVKRINKKAKRYKFFNDIFFNINNDEFIIIPEPNNPLSLHIAIHELVHYYKKHISDGGEELNLRHEYEADRLAHNIIKRLSCGKKSTYIYDDLIKKVIFENINLYTNPTKYIQYDYVYKYLNHLEPITV